jgi:hypothetical protein
VLIIQVILWGRHGTASNGDNHPPNRNSERKRSLEQATDANKQARRLSEGGADARYHAANCCRIGSIS